MLHIVIIAVLCGVASAEKSDRPMSVPREVKGIGVQPGSYEPARENVPQVTAHLQVVTDRPANDFWTNPALIDSAMLLDYAADYDEVTGRYWVALSTWFDSLVKVYYSDDVGATWVNLYNIWLSPNCLYYKLGLVIARGDSNIAHFFIRHDMNNGDIYDFRVFLDTFVWSYHAVSADADTITGFAVCRDYHSDYGLYCVHCNATRQGSNGLFRRSFDFGRTWDAQGFAGVADPNISAGANSNIHTTAVLPVTCNMLWYQNNVNRGDPASWCLLAVLSADTFKHRRPRVASVLTQPDTVATTWVLYYHNYHNSGDLDVDYAFKSHARQDTWTRDRHLAWTALHDEYFPDIRHYKQPNYPYIAASFSVADTSWDTSQVFWCYARADSPTVWTSPHLASDTFRRTDFLLGSQLLGSSYNGGVLFCGELGYYPHGLYFNAPQLGLHDRSAQNLNSGLRIAPNPARGVVLLTSASPIHAIRVYDALGRQVRALDARGTRSTFLWNGHGAHGRKLPAGVYLVRAETQSGAVAGRLLYLP